MKSIIMLSFSIFLLFSSVDGQDEPKFGFGVYEPGQDGPCLSETRRREIQEHILRNVQLLQSHGKLAKIQKATLVLFSWPVQAAPTVTDYGVHGISNFVDQNTAYPGQLLDYNCGRRTYDQASGYNHRGTDIFLWPFAWNKMDNNEVEVVAAAEGTIVYKEDGNYDRSCDFSGTGAWNAVYVRHDDGSTTWNGHLKNGSLTAKGVGARVETGEYLGVVGSSGFSTGPHLHFEVYDANGSLVDPFQGSCNSLNAASWWQSQRPYYDSAVNKVMTHGSAPVFQSCPNPDLINARDDFKPGDRVYFATYYRDQLRNQQSRYTVFKPDGSVFTQWTAQSSAAHYAASYWYWWWYLPLDAPGGRWTFRVEFNGQIYTHEFNIDAPVSVTFDFPVPGGAWYLVSLPVIPDDRTVSALFPGANAAFGWDFVNQNYMKVTELEAGRAYWLLMLAPATVVVSGLPLNTYSHTYTAPGWDLIGAVLQPGTLVDNPDGSVAASFGWDPLTQNYTRIDPFWLEPEQGHWILINGAPSTVSVGNGNSAPMGKKYEAIAFREKYGLLPPPPPFEVASQTQSFPMEFRLAQNYPNPFNPATMIKYELPEETFVRLEIYSITGQRVITLVVQKQAAGVHTVAWDGKDEAGQAMPSGVYFTRMHAGHFAKIIKLTLLK